MTRRSLVADFSSEGGPVTVFDDAKSCTHCGAENTGIRGPDGSAYCRGCFHEHHPELAKERGRR